MRFKKTRINSAILFSLVWLFPVMAQAICKGSPHNPITEVCWQCMFPMKIGGVTVVPSLGSTPSEPDAASAPVCACPIPVPPFVRVGIPVSFWEPARFVEVVKDAFCFPSIGASLNSNPGSLCGGSQDQGGVPENPSTFFQAHYAIYPVWSMLELFTDSVCVEHSGFDMAYITEVDPTWNSDGLAMIIYPETLLFANLPAQLSCVADSVASNIGHPISAMFWCLGSLGSTYPMSGHISEPNIVQASLAAASRLIYKMARIGTVCDTGLNLCTCVPTPIWVKRDYHFSIAKPVTGFQCIPVGRSSLIWGSLKNPPLPATGTSPDNFMYIVFRKRVCCAF